MMSLEFEIINTEKPDFNQEQPQPQGRSAVDDAETLYRLGDSVRTTGLVKMPAAERSAEDIKPPDRTEDSKTSATESELPTYRQTTDTETTPPDLSADSGGRQPPDIPPPPTGGDRGDDWTHEPEPPDRPKPTAERAERVLSMPQVEVKGIPPSLGAYEATEQIFRKPGSDQVFEGQLPIDESRRQLIIAVEEDITRVAADAGVDVSHRLLYETEYHLFASRDELQAALRSLGIMPNHDQIGQFNEFGYFLDLSHSEGTMLCAAIHEGFHSVEHFSAEFKEGADPLDLSFSDILNVSLGYKKLTFENGRISRVEGWALHEMATDLAMFHARTLRHPEPRLFMDELGMLGLELIDKTALAKNLDPRQVLREIELGSLTNDRTGLQRIKNYLGPERFALLENARPSDGPELIDQLGLAEKVKEVSSGKKRVREIWPWLYEM